MYRCRLTRLGRECSRARNGGEEKGGAADAACDDRRKMPLLFERKRKGFSLIKAIGEGAAAFFEGGGKSLKWLRRKED